VGQRTCRRKSKSESITRRNKNEKRVIREWRGQPTRGRAITFWPFFDNGLQNPALWPRDLSKTRVVFWTDWSMFGCYIVVGGSPKRQASEADAILVCASPTRRERAWLIKRVAPKFAWLDSEVWVKEWWCSVFWEDEPCIWLVKTNHTTEGNYRGYPPMGTLFIYMWCFSTNPGLGDDITRSREVGYIKRSDSLPHIPCLLVDMKYWGLIDPKDKPFGRWLPIEVQWRIMFFAECCHQWQAAGYDAWDPIVTEMCCDRMAANTRQLPAMESSGQVQPVSQDKLLSPLPLTFRPPIVHEWY